jgi:hypothetical protein
LLRGILMGLFWVWGAFGLIGNLLSLNSQIGVAALSSQLLWIGGMLLFGLGALLLPPTMSVAETMKKENTEQSLPPLGKGSDSDRERNAAP